MKVLFAVNDENISTSIVKKYQKQYKEIISYKNVYYFNAILKELQKNKSYDRIVISEELEEFTSTSYEQKDKFIFDKLDNISDEAISINGVDIPIIVICSETRNKGEAILVKLFSIGVYNAIIGADRTTEEVCNLINKPRSKKEAKIYYHIDSEEVSYEKENENEVSEVELQNILRHFKRIEDNEEQYVESFKNIVSQYNKAQMKIVIAILPDNVKSVLQKNSSEYREIMGTPERNSREENKENKKYKKGISKTLKSTSKGGTSEKLIGTEDGTKLSKPVVVPTTLEDNIFKKLKPAKKIEMVEEDFEEDSDDDIEDDVQEILEKTSKKRGRPKKNVDETEITETKTKKRGRPKKQNADDEIKDIDEIEEQEDLEEKDSYSDGKSNLNDSILPGLEENIDEENYDDDQSEEQFNSLPGLEEEEEDNNIDIDKENELNSDEEQQYKEGQNVHKYLPEFEENNTIVYKNDNNVNVEHFSNRINSNNDNVNMKKYDNVFDGENFDVLLSGDKKVVTFVGTSKNGTSFIVNNVALILSSMGINTAILDATTNKNAYYIYTKNDENLRKIASSTFENLKNGYANGIRVNNKLTVYTTVPIQNEQIKNSRPILETLVRNHSIVLIDADFSTPIEYFDKAQELYLVQSMDVLTIQPLTEFLRDLKSKNVLDERKIRIVLNKLLKLRSLSGKNIVGGMSNYNDPEMSFMTELFDRSSVKISAQIPFDEDAYIRYLEGLVECDIKINGYPKEFKQKLVELAEKVYPLLPGQNSKNSKKNYNDYSNSFTQGMNSTLENMRKKY